MTRTAGSPNSQGPFGNTLPRSAVVSSDTNELKRLRARDDRVEQLLDHALEETFPASDPIAVTVR